MDSNQINLLRKSNWNIYYGIVAEDKEIDSNIITAYLPEMMPNMEGNIGDYTDVEVANIFDEQADMDMDIKINTSNTFTCTFYNLITNRTDIPHVRKGEIVWVFQYADTDIYMWFPTGQSDHLRRLDTYRISVSGVSDKDKIYTSVGDDDSYVFEIDTLKKKAITIRTSDGDGEAFKYTIKIDSISNSITIQDDDNNEIKLESEIPRIRAINKSNTFVDLYDDNLLLAAPNDVTIKAGRQMLLKAPVGTINFDKTMVLNAAGMTMNGGNLSMNGGTLGLNGSVRIKELIAGPIQAVSYSSGGYPGGYPAPSTDLGEGAGNNPPASPSSPSDDGNRHASAWEQVSAAMSIIEQCLADINGAIGVGSAGGQVEQLGQSSLMPKNKGE